MQNKQSPALLKGLPTQKLQGRPPTFAAPLQGRHRPDPLHAVHLPIFSLPICSFRCFRNGQSPCSELVEIWRASSTSGTFDCFAGKFA
ncbi:uncharacterized protein METZ01_LOCUS321006, partial [marine metagenome]